MARNDQPRTGDGRTSGQKPGRAQVTAKTSSDTTLWKQTAALFSKKKPAAAPQVAKPVKANRPKRHPFFGE